MFKKDLRVYLPLIISFSIVCGLIVGYYLPKKYTSDSKIAPQGINKLPLAIDYIRRSYVDTIGYSRLQDSALTGLLHQLDPHSDYIPASAYATVVEPLEDGFQGIGIQFRMIDDTAYILDVMKASPAFKAGLKIGDRIIYIDKDTLVGKKYTTEDVVNRLKRIKGASENVTIVRRGFRQPKKILVSRAKISTHSIDLAFMPQSTTGYIKLGLFAENSGEDFSETLRWMVEQDMKTLILDLRGNTGGVMSAAIDIADELLPDLQMIVYTMGANRSKTEYKATYGGTFEEGKIMVLIDEESASASEIVAGALQDNDRATLIGQRTFGKGLVQEQLSFADGSAMRLTVARYYSPSGRCIQKPFGTDRATYYEETFERGDEATKQDSLANKKRQVYKTQNGRTVYGGGGIQPDVKIAYPKSPERTYVGWAQQKNILDKTAFKLADAKRAKLLAQYPDYDAFTLEYKTTPEVFAQIHHAMVGEGFTLDESIRNKTDELLNKHIKCYLALYLYGYEAYYRMSLTVDDAYLQALESIK
jgi:carboxyl-terminal processing protease